MGSALSVPSILSESSRLDLYIMPSITYRLDTIILQGAESKLRTLQEARKYAIMQEAPSLILSQGAILYRL